MGKKKTGEGVEGAWALPYVGQGEDVAGGDPGAETKGAVLNPGEEHSRQRAQQCQGPEEGA